MKSIHLLLLLGTLCVLIVPSFQYGTIFTDYLSTPVNFTDITETYISGIKSKTAYANTASVETITATNPDGFYVNSPGSLNAVAGQNLELTSAQSVVFGSDDTISSSLTSGGDLNIQNDRTDVDVDDLTLTTGNTLSLASDGPLLVQGNNIDISTAGQGFVTARDVIVDSATYTEVSADADILLNATYHTSFTSENGDISVVVEDVATYQANFINVDSSFGVDINSAGDVNINAFAILEMQAAQFAQVRASEDITVAVVNGDFDIQAAATAAFASENSVIFFSSGQTEIYSFGDSESVVQFNAPAGSFLVLSENSLNIGTFVDSYDVDLISKGSMDVLSSSTQFVANNDISSVAGNDLTFTVTDSIDINSLDLDATSYGDSFIYSTTGSVTLETVENFNAQAKDVVLSTTDDIQVSAREVSFIQANPATLSRAEPNNLLIESNIITTNSVTTQFDTIGEFILSTPELLVNAATVDIRSSAGPHNVNFFVRGTVDVEADDDIVYRGSNIRFDTQSGYNTTSQSLNFVSDDSSDNIFHANTDVYINSPRTSFSSGEDTTIEAEEDEVNLIMSDAFVQNSYNQYLQAVNDVHVNSSHTITIGANEYINVESVLDSIFDSDSVFVSGKQTGSMFAENIDGSITNANFYAGNTHYFTANLPTDSFDINSVNISFTGDTTLESGRNLQITTATAFFQNMDGSLMMQGYDYVNIDSTSTFDIDSDAQVSFSSDGSIDITSDSMETFTVNAVYRGNQLDSRMSISSDGTYLVDSFVIEEVSRDGSIEFSGNTVTFSAGDSEISTTDITSFVSESTLTMFAPTYVSNSRYLNFQSQNNAITSTSTFTISAANADVNSGAVNNFQSVGDFSSTSNDSWFLGGELDLDGDTLTFSAAGQGYFYSDDQITFDVEETITIQSDLLNFVLPLDGLLFLEGLDTSIESLATAPFIFQSYGATNLQSEGSITYASDANTVFDSVTAHINSGGLTFQGTPAQSSVTFFAHEGEVEFSASSYALNGATNSFLASRDVNIKGDTLFSSGQSDASTTLRLNAFLNTNVTEALAVLAETVHEDSHIVFNSLSGNIQTNAGGNIFINSEGTQSITGAFGFSSTADQNTAFTITGNHNLQTATGTAFVSGDNWSLTAQGQTYIQSGLNIAFQNTLEDDPLSPFVVFSVTADSMTVTTSQEGALEMSSSSDLLYLTTGSQSWEVTHFLVSQSTDSDYTSTVGDIVTQTSAGRILSEFATFTGNAGTNITFNSGHDSTFSAGLNTYSAGLDVLTRSLDGKIVFTNGAAATFVANDQVTIDAEGVRTVPRDGVFFGGNNILMESTGAASQIYLYAKRSVTFGEFTRPDVRFNAGGNGNQNGWVLTSDGKISLDAGTQVNFNSDGQYTLTTSQATIFNSGGAFNIQSTGTLTGSADNIQISSLIGNIHFHSKLDSHWTTSSQFLASSTTGYVSFTTLDSAVFSAAGNFKETANTLTYSFDQSYTSLSSITNFDGHNYFDITTQLGSDGSIIFESGNGVFQSGGTFNINTYGDDAKIELNAVGNLTIRTPKSGLISFSSDEDFLNIYAEYIFEFANKAYTITSNSNIGDDPSHGAIEYYVLGSTRLTAQDTIDLTASEDVSILAGTLLVSSTGDFLANSNWDQEWILGNTATQSYNSVVDVLGGIYFRNSPGGGGDININTAGKFDITYLNSINGDIVSNIGNNQIGSVDEGFRINTFGSDFKDEFGIRFQTEGAADLEVYSSASAVFTGHKNVRFDASDDLEVYGGIGVSLIAQGVNLDNEGVLFVASKGDVQFHTAQSPISFVGNHIDVVGNGTEANEGVIKLIANGISNDSEYGIRLQVDAAVAAFGSIEADINVAAKESIDINLNYQGAHALFGYQRNAAEALANLFPYDFFDPYIPSNHINTPLQSETYLIATGIGADIVFDTQKPEDGVGQFIAYAGHIEEVFFSETNAPSQLQLIAYGNGEVEGDITFIQQGGLTFRGTDKLDSYFILGSPPEQSTTTSNILFQANDDASDIEIKTSKEALFADINIVTPELTIHSENKLLIRSNDRNGDSNVQFDSDTRIQVSTTGQSQGPGSELPGIELRSYESIIEVDAGNTGDVIHHALRDMYIEADNGYEFNSQGGMTFTTGSFLLRSSSGDLTYRYNSIDVDADGTITFATFDSNYISADFIEYAGGDINIRGDLIQFDADDTIAMRAYGGDVSFNYNDWAVVSGSNIFMDGYMSIPMTDELIIPGASCTDSLLATTQRLVIARSPPYDPYNIFGLNYQAPQYAFYNSAIYSGLGLRLCTCGNIRTGDYRWSCMNFSQFNT